MPPIERPEKTPEDDPGPGFVAGKPPLKALRYPRRVSRPWVRSLLLLLLVAATNPVRAQVSIADSAISFAFLGVHYGGFLPGGELAERFGYTSVAGAEIGYKHKSHFYLAAGAQYLFGENVKEQNQLDQMAFQHVWSTTTGGAVVDYGFVDENGFVHRPEYFQRGLLAQIRVGRQFPEFRLSRAKENPNSGPFLELGVQFIEHFIFYQFQTERAPYVSDERLKNYDRRTNGIGMMGAIGYRFFSNRRFVNLYLALELSVHATQNRRSLNWDTNTVDDAVRNDVLYGFRIGWLLPMYRTAATDYYYY